jgi:hypothetical protein
MVLLAKLPRSDNPEKGSVGSPDAGWGSIPPHSYGVHPPPPVKVLLGFGLRATTPGDLKWDYLSVEISAGRPMIAAFSGG